MIKKILKFLGWTLLFMVIMGVAAYIILNKALPSGAEGDLAERITDEMLTALNKPAYDSITYIEFTYVGKHHIKWDKEKNSVNVSWGEQDIYLDLNQNKESYSLLEYKAYEYFVNDTFWLIAPFKVRDNGVVRKYVDIKEGRGLLVTYTSGGVTPGDSYLWILDENGFPKAWRLWTSNVPVGGLELSWDGWIKMNDTWFSTLHEGSILDLTVTDMVVR